MSSLPFLNNLVLKLLNGMKQSGHQRRKGVHTEGQHLNRDRAGMGYQGSEQTEGTSL